MTGRRRAFLQVVVRVVVADDHPAVRAGLRALFAADPRIGIVGEAANGRIALELIEQLTPDVVLLDNDMPEMSGVEVARRLRARPGPRPKIVFLSGEELSADDAALGDRALVKDGSAWEIVQVILEVAAQR